VSLLLPQVSRLNENSIADHGAIAPIESLNVMANFVKLNLSCSTKHDGVAIALAESYNSKARLLELLLAQNCKPDNGASDLVEELKKRRMTVEKWLPMKIISTSLTKSGWVIRRRTAQSRERDHGWSLPVWRSGGQWAT